MRGSSPPKVVIGDSPADLAAATNSPRLKDTAANFGDLPLLPDDGRILHLPFVRLLLEVAPLLNLKEHLKRCGKP